MNDQPTAIEKHVDQICDMVEKLAAHAAPSDEFIFCCVISELCHRWMGHLQNSDADALIESVKAMENRLETKLDEAE